MWLVRAIPSFSMGTMENRIIELGLRRFFPRRGRYYNLPIHFQKGIDKGDHLASDPSNNFELSLVGASPLIIHALERDQAFVNLRPLAIHTNGIANNQEHHLFDRPCSALGEVVSIQRGSRLSRGWCPSKIGLECGCIPKIGNSADGCDHHSCLSAVIVADGDAELHGE